MIVAADAELSSDLLGVDALEGPFVADVEAEAALEGRVVRLHRHHRLELHPRTVQTVLAVPQLEKIGQVLP